MAKVWYDAKTKDWVHENGRTIPAQDIRTLPHHRRAVLALMGEQPTGPNGEQLPYENETQAEIRYVETILGDGND